MNNTDTKSVEELLSRRVESILPNKHKLQELLLTGKKIKLYQGFDPSKPDLHIGHLVGLLTLRAFQELGHQVIFLIGDFTGRIGDPSDKSAVRPKLSQQEVVQNAKTYQDQAGKILRFEGDNPAQIRFNSDWLNQLSFADVVELASHFTVQQMIERDMFQQRLKKNEPIYLHEFLYPLMVTKDAQALDVDLELGGNDQLFNMSVGRRYLKDQTGKDKFVLTTKLLTDSQGRKIGKTTGNAINLFDDPNNLFGQVMALSDDVVVAAYKLATDLTMDEIQEIKDKIFTQSPMEAKKKLAHTLVRMCYDETTATSAEKHFESTVQHKDLPDEVPTVEITAGSYTSLQLLTLSALGDTNSQRKRVIYQGGFQLNKEKITDPNQQVTVKSGDVLRFGKREFAKIK